MYICLSMQIFPFLSNNTDTPIKCYINSTVYSTSLYTIKYSRFEEVIWGIKINNLIFVFQFSLNDPYNYKPKFKYVSLKELKRSV